MTDRSTRCAMGDRERSGAGSARCRGRGCAAATALGFAGAIRAIAFLLAGACSAGAIAAEAEASASEAAEASATERTPGPGVPEPAESQGGVGDDALDVDAILNNPLDDEAYRQRKTCLRLRSVDRVEILDDTMVLFHVRRDKAWLNQLSSRCLGLDDDMIPNFRSFGGSVCRLDTLRGMSRGGGPFGVEAHCRLGDFEEIDAVQIEALRAALVERRKAADMARKTRRAEKRAKRAAKSGR